MFNHIFHSSSHPSNAHSSHKKKEYDFLSAKPIPIGTGGYSEVLKAKWKARDNMLVAVKVVRKEAVKDNKEYFKLLSRGFGRIRACERICYSLDWFESTHKYYVTFPLLTGGELLERLNKRGRFTEAASKRVMKVMLETLEFIHSKGIIHRDIKPDNFLYRHPDAEVDDFLMIDFGICAVTDHFDEDDPKDQYEIAGTPGYAAPEVFFRKGYGKNADVFGAGVIAYNILSASSPWKSTDYVQLIRETMRAQVEFRPGPFKDVSDEACAFVSALVDPNPHRRPSSKRALEHPWLSSLHASDIPEHHEPPSREDPERIPVPRPPTLKPDHPIARQMTARGVDSVAEEMDELEIQEKVKEPSVVVKDQES